MKIETKRLLIREFFMDDASDLDEILGDEETMKYAEPAYDLEKTKKFLAEFCIGRRGAVAAVHREREKVIGYILFHELEKGVYEMGWFFNRNYWHQGYAYEACKAVMDYGFHELQAHKIFAETIDSVKSVPLMKKLGMQLEGIQQSQVKDSSGSWADLHLYGRLKEDWTIIPYDEKYRDDMIFMVLEAKNALGRVPRLNEDLLDIQGSYLDKGDMFWLALDRGDRVIGCMGYNSIPGTTEVKLHRLYVKCDRKRQGIGTALLQTAEAHIRNQGKTAAYVHLGGKAYFESRSFYPKHGYAEHKPSYMKKVFD